MSPVSPVCYTVGTVRIGHKTQLEWEHPFRRNLILKYSTLLSFHRVLHEMNSMKGNKVVTSIHLNIQR